MTIDTLLCHRNYLTCYNNKYLIVAYLYVVYLTFSGLYLYMLVVETFSAENIKLKVYATIGWGK